MKVKIGDDLPSALVFFLDNSNLVQKKDIRDFTVSGKTIIFGLPGAFTSVCSAKHLPGFVNSYENALKKGVQNILSKKENYTKLDNNIDIVKNHILKRINES